MIVCLKIHYFVLKCRWMRYGRSKNSEGNYHTDISDQASYEKGWVTGPASFDQ